MILAWRIRKKEETKKKKLLHWSLALDAASIVYLLAFSRYQYDLGGCMLVILPYAVYGLTRVVLFHSDRFTIFCTAVSFIYAFLLAISSNVGPRSFCGPLILACAVTSMDFEWNPKRGEGLFSAGLIVLLVFFKTGQYYEGGKDFSVRITEGPMAGIYDSQKAVSAYEDRLKDIETINQMDDYSYAALITTNSWEYLALDKRIAANSTYLYFWEEEEYTACMDAYYQMHPDRYPAYFYLDTQNIYHLDKTDSWMDQLEFLMDLSAGSLWVRK